MGNNNSSRQYTYQQYYSAVIKKNPEFDFSKINLSLLNPYEVLEIHKNFKWDELKIAYRKTALLTHPDKEGGNRLIFNFVVSSFSSMKIKESDGSASTRLARIIRKLSSKYVIFHKRI